MRQEQWAGIDEGWGDIDAPDGTNAASEKNAAAADASDGVEATRRKRTRARGKQKRKPQAKAVEPASRPEQGRRRQQQTKSRDAASSVARHELHKERARRRDETRRPAWLVPVIVFVGAVAVFALALVAAAR